MPNLPNSSLDNPAKGAYAVAEWDDPELILIGTGSEVSLCTDAGTRGRWRPPGGSCWSSSRARRRRKRSPGATRQVAVNVAEMPWEALPRMMGAAEALHKEVQEAKSKGIAAAKAGGPKRRPSERLRQRDPW